MHFAKLSTILLGLAAFASAFPHPNERRMVWTPRSQRKDSGGKNNKDTLTIVDTTVVELTEKSRNSEVELTIRVQETIQSEDQKKKAKDNVRRNHYRNKNKDVVCDSFSNKWNTTSHTYQNTIIIVVTEIIDIRDSNNHNKRYMKHQLRADNGKQNDITVQVTEVVAITISNSNQNGGNGRTTDNALAASAATAASGAVANAIQTMNPNAPFPASNQTVLLPSGAAAPQGQNTEIDPAAIVEDVTVELIVLQVSS
jgi:hypothetical protein